MKWKSVSAFCLFLPLFCGAVEPIVNHFDSPEEIRRWHPWPQEKCRDYFSAEVRAAGSGGFLRDSIGRALPEWRSGVLSFFLYDPGYERFRNNPPPGVIFDFVRMKNGKQETIRYDMQRRVDGWSLKFFTEKVMVPLPAFVRGGWNRVDVVNPGAGENGARFQLYLNGIKIHETRESFLFIRSFHCTGIKAFDEFSYHPDPKSFRKNPVQRILPEEFYGTYRVEAGGKLRIPLKAEPGTVRKEGEIKLRLVNGQGDMVSETAFLPFGSGTAVPTLPLPARSGGYYLESVYREPGSVPYWTTEPVDLQIFHPGTADPAQMPLALSEREWEFLPVGSFRNKRWYEDPVFSEKAFPEPERVPEDWSKAGRLRGAWQDRRKGWSSNLGQNWVRAWYRQHVAVPAAWNGKKIMLSIDDPYTVVHVFANGRKAGTTEWPGGSVDLTGFAVPGKTLDLALCVTADPNFGYMKQTRQILGNAFKLPSLQAYGLTGDVLLRPESRGAGIASAKAVPSVSERKLSVVFRLKNLEKGRRYQLKAQVQAAGRIVRELPEKSFLARQSAETQTLSVSWNDPILWELDAPYLYDLTASLSGEGRVLDRMAQERFGFREVSAKGPALLLNGRPVTLFLTLQPALRNPDSARMNRRLHFNATYAFTGHRDARILDESGMTGASIVGMAERHIRDCVIALVRAGKGEDPRFWNGIEELLKKRIHKLRNNPSVLIYVGSMGGHRTHNGSMYNPLYANGTWLNIPDSHLGREILKGGLRHINLLRRLAPGTVITQQDAGSLNDARHITEYQGFKPIQEYIEEGLYWSRVSTKPFFISEQAAPFYANWTDACSKGKGWNGVPCLNEWSAITHGDEAFLRTPFQNELLKRLEADLERRRREAQEKASTAAERTAALKKIRMTADLQFVQGAPTDELHARIWSDRIRQQYFFLRAHRIGMMSMMFAGGGCGPKLETLLAECQAPVTGFLAGTKEKITVKTHLFRPGEMLERGAVLLNNSPRPEKVLCRWTLELDGKTLARSEQTEIVPAGGQKFLPFQFKLPETLRHDVSGTLSVVFERNGKEIRSDSCSIDVLAPEPRRKEPCRIALIDPEFASMKAFDRCGIAYHAVVWGENLEDYDVIVFGRRAFRYEYQQIPEGIDLGRLLRLGKKIIILEQEEKTLRERFQFRTEYVSPRNVFGRTEGHPLLRGLPDRCLAYWRGEATLTDGYEVARNAGRVRETGFGDGGTWFYPWNDGSDHQRPMKWGNTHNVATVTIIKPDTGNFRTLIDCEYAANYAAALELREGRGLLIFSQLDISGRTEHDPAAERYLKNLVHYAATVRVPASRKVFYAGGTKGRSLLEKLGIGAESVEHLSDLPENGIVVLGEFSPEDLLSRKNELRQFAERGGTVFSLRKTPPFDWLPFPVKTERKRINQTRIGKGKAPLLAGLGNADFFWKGNLEIDAAANPKLTETGILEEFPCGKGNYVLCQLSPELFGDVSLNHYLKENKQWSERTIRQLLTNLGAELPPPAMLNAQKAVAEAILSLDLSGEWLAAKASELPGADSPVWRKVTLPGDLQSAAVEWKSPAGTFFCKKTVVLENPPPSGAVVRILFGSISGTDILSVNGKTAGFTNLQTNPNGTAIAVREYEIPASFFRRGANELLLRIDYDFYSALGLRESTGGISAPAELRVWREKQTNSTLPEEIDLAAKAWQGLSVGKDRSATYPSLEKRSWKSIRVPGQIQKQRREWAGHTGYFWYRTEFHLEEELPDNALAYLIIGAADDEDTVFFNGVQIGHTGRTNAPDCYWSVQRRYPIPRKLFRTGVNRIQIQLNDLNNSGGIVKSPVKIQFESPEKNRKKQTCDGPYLYPVGKEDDPYWHHGF